MIAHVYIRYFVRLVANSECKKCFIVENWTRMYLDSKNRVLAQKLIQNQKEIEGEVERKGGMWGEKDSVHV